MSWSTVREAVRLAVASATQLDDVTGLRGGPVHRVEWQGRATQARAVKDLWADLRFYSVSGSGIDETRYDATTGIPTYTGPRTFRVQVLLQSTNQEPTADAVGVLAGKLRTRIRRAETIAALQAAGVGTISIGPTLEVDYSDANGREVSASSTEIHFSTAESDTDSQGPGFIENLQADGTLAPSYVGGDIDVPVVYGTIV